MTVTNSIKHSGAGWVKNLYRRDGSFSMSAFGIKVANIMGQVGLGIYHYHDNIVGRNAPDWSDEDEIAVVLTRELASFDGCELSLLAMCCEASGATFRLHGRTQGYLAITFHDEPLVMPAPSESKDGWSIKQFLLVSKISKVLRHGSGEPVWEKERWKYFGGDGEIDNMEISVSNTKRLDIPQAIVDAHQACIRVSFSGLSSSSMAVQVSRRDRTGRIDQRHPTWDDHKKMLQPYWDIDYTSKG